MAETGAREVGMAVFGGMLTYVVIAGTISVVDGVFKAVTDKSLSTRIGEQWTKINPWKEE